MNLKCILAGGIIIAAAVREQANSISAPAIAEAVRDD